MSLDVAMGLSGASRIGAAVAAMAAVAAIAAGTGSGKVATMLVAFAAGTGSGNAATATLAAAGAAFVALGTRTGSAALVALGTRTGSGNAGMGSGNAATGSGNAATATLAGAGDALVASAIGTGSGNAATMLVAFGAGTGSGDATTLAGAGGALAIRGLTGWTFVGGNDGGLLDCGAGDAACMPAAVAPATMSVVVARGAGWSKMPLAAAIAPMAVATRPTRTKTMKLAAGSIRPNAALNLTTERIKDLKRLP